MYPASRAQQSTCASPSAPMNRRRGRHRTNLSGVSPVDAATPALSTQVTGRCPATSGGPLDPSDPFPRKMLHETVGRAAHAARLAESAIGEADPVCLDELCRRGLLGGIIVGRGSCYSRHCIGYDIQSRFSRIRRRSSPCAAPLKADRPYNRSVRLYGKLAAPRRYTRKRGDAGQKRRVAWIKLKKSE